jgi:hypothetical protein
LCIIAHGIQVESNGAGLEQRLSSLQLQIDDLRHVATDDVLPLEQRLATLTEYTEGILKRWAATADRHAQAVGQLETHLRELNDTGTQLQDDARHRLQELERIVQHEWTALRSLHEAPVRQLVEQAASLTEVCIATANSAQHGFDRTEARLAALEADFHRTTADLTREVQTLLSEVRQLSTSTGRQLPGDAPSWPLEDVTRLHQQLRETSQVNALPAARPTARPMLSLGEAPVLEAEHTEGPAAAAYREPPYREPAVETPPSGSAFRLLVVGLVVIGLVAAGGFAWRLQQDLRAVSERADQSQLQSKIAEAASREAADKQEAADRQLVAARDLASRAQIVGDVLAAPDLIRFTLTNPGALPAASGQVLFSRARGFVFSASGLPAPPRNSTYQVWLLTRTGAVSVATFAPDSAGRVTVTASVNIPRPVYGAIVTTERAEGAQAPSGEPVLSRLPVVPAQS